MIRTVSSSVLVGVLLLGVAAGQTPESDPLETFLEAVDLDDREGDVAEALGGYSRVIDDESAPPRLRARALQRYGRCHERLGAPDLARQAYERLLREFPQAAGAKEAREALAALDQPEGAPEQVHLVRDDAMHVTLRCQDADVRQLLLLLAREAALSITLSSSVTGKVTLDLRRVEPLRVLRLVVETIGLRLVHDEALRHVRVQSAEAFEWQLDLRAYRLVPLAPDDLKAWSGRRASLAGLQELLASSGLACTASVYDPTTQAVFVVTSPLEHSAVRSYLGGTLQTAPPRAPAEEDRRVTIQFSDANVRTVIQLLASHTRKAILIAPELVGQITLAVNDMPALAVLDQVIRASGDFEWFETVAGLVVVPLSRNEQWLVTSSWPLALDPSTFWRAGGHALTEGEPWPEHPFQRVLSELAASREIAGAAAHLEPVSHRVLSRLPQAFAAQLKQALRECGYLAPRQPALETRLSKSWDDASVRTVLSEIAKELGVNVIVSPEVAGTFSGNCDLGGPAQGVLESVARVGGGYVVISDGGGLYRVVPLAADEAKLTTRSLSLVNRSPATFPMLQAALNELVVSADLPGALVVPNPADRSLVVSLPSSMLRELEIVVADCDVVALEPGATLVVGSSVRNAVGAYPTLEVRVVTQSGALAAPWATSVASSPWSDGDLRETAADADAVAWASHRLPGVGARVQLKFRPSLQGEEAGEVEAERTWSELTVLDTRPEMGGS